MKLLLLLLLPLQLFSQTIPQQIKAWQQQSLQVTIIEDNWGVPHIYGKTDADVVFGLMYLQCSQNFARVERNYVEIMGRLSELDGVNKLYDDLQMRLLYDSTEAKKDFVSSPKWLKKLLLAFADGINFYLYKHPEIHPRLLKKFEPWFPLMYTDGSIAPTQTGGLTVNDLKNIYEGDNKATSFIRPELSINGFTPAGSNGFAIAPAKTASKKAILYINPHVTFYFRTEAHLVSEEGLNAYGAITWGQFFVYQGFNEHCGWMHTSSYADVADVYKEKIKRTNQGFSYLYMDLHKPMDTFAELKVGEKKVQIFFRDSSGRHQKTFTTYYTHHGPIMGKWDGAWLSLKEHNRSRSSLMQSWLRTKADGFAAYKTIMNMRINNSNNTVFADDKGNIAYWHGNFMPRRNAAYDWTLPVDGSTSKTEWQGLHLLDETIHIYNPASGWIQNCNSTPFTASGTSSPDKKNYPAYMAPEGQNGRAVNAIRLLKKATNLTIDDVIKIGYDSHLSAFDILLPSLFNAYKNLPEANALKSILKKPIAILQVWDKAASDTSVATTLAIEWVYKMATKIPPAKTPEAATNAIGNYITMSALAPLEQLQILEQTIIELEKMYSSWQIAWGKINRYQRSTDNHFKDDDSSMPVGLGPGTWGSLPSFYSRRIDTKKRYGVSGNSFVAVVEFGKRIKAKTIITGGESFDPSSPHFTDQAPGYISGQFKTVNFYKEDVIKHKERLYHPGE